MPDKASKTRFFVLVSGRYYAGPGPVYTSTVLHALPLTHEAAAKVVQQHRKGAIVVPALDHVQHKIDQAGREVQRLIDLKDVIRNYPDQLTLGDEPVSIFEMGDEIRAMPESPVKPVLLKLLSDHAAGNITVQAIGINRRSIAINVGA